MPQWCYLLYPIVIWGLFGFEVFHDSASGLVIQLLAFALEDKKGGRIPDIDVNSRIA